MVITNTTVTKKVLYKYFAFTQYAIIFWRFGGVCIAKNILVGSIFLVLILVVSLAGGIASAVTPPNSITSYVPVTIHNTQTSAFAANAQILLPFNALKYQSYESNSLNNTEFFYANGTVIPSWLEGNTLSEQAAANTLYKSANVVFWVLVYPSNTLLCASCSNTIYLGFASKTTNLLVV